jgi:hypothetical protein
MLTALALAMAIMQNTEAAPQSKTTAHVESVKHAAELKIRNLLDPVFIKHCPDDCKLLSISVDVDITTPDEVAPGFDDVDPRAMTDLSPSAAKIKVLIADRVGQVSRSKLLDLTQQFLDTLDFPVKIDTQIAHFPEPITSAAKIAELRERVAKQFRATIDDLFKQFCPDQCMLADFQLSTDLVNAEEAQYGVTGEFIQDGSMALKITNVAGTILVDESIPAEVRANVLEMAKLKTNYLKNVNLVAKSMKFPKPVTDANMLGGIGGAQRNLASTSKNSESKTSSTNETNAKQERYERIEKIERVENGDAVQAELQKFKVYGLVFACSIISLLIFLAMTNIRPRAGNSTSTVHRIVQSLSSDPVSTSAPSTYSPDKRRHRLNSG